jgi:putative thioredoxin
MLFLDGHSQTTQKNSDFIKDITSANFATDVLDASQNKIVLVDFWAPWCAPCKQLGPLLERTVMEQAGKVVLAKINVDENPEIAAQLRVQSLPTVYAFIKGQPVDAFMGVVSEQKLQAFLQNLLEMMDIPEDLNLEITLKQAQDAFDQDRYEDASRFWTKILKEMPNQENALAGLAHCYLIQGAPEPAEDILKRIPDEIKKTTQSDSLENHLALLKEAKNYLLKFSPNLSLPSSNLSLSSSDLFRGSRDSRNKCENDNTGKVDLERDLLKDEKNPLEISYQNALQGLVGGRFKKAIEELLSLVQTDKNWQDGLAKTTLLKVFAALGHSHSLTLENRRKLSAVIFS